MSRKIVSDNFKEVVQQSPVDQGLLIYSKNCPGCHVLGQKYEQTARNCLTDSDLQFNRLNSDNNKLASHVNFGYTPVMMHFKAGQEKGYRYLSSSIYDRQVQSFFEVTKAFQVMDEGLLRERVGERQESQVLLAGLLQTIR